MPTSSDDPGGIAREVFDILIIGAGVIGSALAVTFARQGRNVLILERNLEEPNRIVGELLQPGGVAALQKLGMGDCLEGIGAIPVEGYEIFYRGENIIFRYPPMETKKDPTPVDDLEIRERNGHANHTSPVTKRRPQGRSFHHGKFIMKLRETARGEERVRVVEATAKELLRCEKSEQVIGVMCLTRSGKEQKVRSFLSLLPLFRA